jgi:hypothetical protein
MLKVAAVTALPSEIWPFRKIFLPRKPVITLAEQQQAFSVIIDPTTHQSMYDIFTIHSIAHLHPAVVSLFSIDRKRRKR